MGQQEDDELSNESGNSIHESLTDKEKFQRNCKRNRRIIKNDKNKDKLRYLSLNLLKQAQENPEDVLKKTQ